MANHELVRKWLGEDIFYHAGIVESVNKSEAHPNLFMLQEQRRMHADISKFTNSFIYKIEYTIIRLFQNVRNLRNYNRSQMRRVFYLIRAKWELFVKRSSGSRFNIMSGLVAMQMMLIGLLDGVQSIGIVTPYRAQSRF